MATAVYPANVRSFGSDVVDFTTTILAEHVNFLRAEVNSVETVIGNLPLTTSGWTGSFDRSTTTWNTVRDRIANIEFGLNSAYNAMVPSGGTTGQVLVKSSSSDYAMSWTTGNFLPSQLTHSGQFLTTDGTTASWASVPASYNAPTLGSTSIASGATVSNVNGLTINSTTIPTSKTLVATDSTAYVVPSQATNSGKFLTTNGSISSWASINQYTAPTLGSTSIDSGATLSNVNGLTINSTTIPSSKTLVATDSTAYVVPSQSGQTGKYLTTNGSSSYWAVVSAGESFSPFLLIGA